MCYGALIAFFSNNVLISQHIFDISGWGGSQGHSASTHHKISPRDAPFGRLRAVQSQRKVIFWLKMYVLGINAIAQLFLNIFSISLDGVVARVPAHRPTTK